MVFGAADGRSAARYCSTSAFQSTGWAVALAGDVNGDGYSDLVGGAPYANTGGGVEEGVAFVWYGKDTDRSGESRRTRRSENLTGSAPASGSARR